MSNNIRALITSDKAKAQFAAALPKHCSPDRFCRVALTALTRNPKLADCTQESLFRCLLDLSAMGLEPDGRRAHLIPYGKECTLVVDYKGLVELARRNGKVVKIHADIVCEHDEFEWNLGEVSRHSYELGKPRGKAIGAFAQVWSSDGSVQGQLMSREEIEAVRARSRAANSGPWVTDWNEMAKKTVFRRLSKWLDLSPEIEDALDAEDRPPMRTATVRDATPPPPMFPQKEAPQLEEPAAPASTPITGNQYHNYDEELV